MMNSDSIHEYILSLEHKIEQLIEQQNVLVSLICANDEDYKRVYDLEKGKSYE